MKLYSIKDETSQNIALFNMNELVRVWENHLELSLTFEFSSGCKIQVKKYIAYPLLEKAGIEIESI